MSKERRRHPRKNQNVTVSYKVCENHQNSTVLEATQNISVGGICIFLNEPLEGGTILTLTMALDSSPGNSFEAKARLRWRVPEADPSGKYLAGLEFIEVSEGAVQMIETLEGED